MDKKYSLIPLPEKSSSIYADILTALTPVLVWAIYLYSLRPLVLLTIGIITAITVDIIFDIILKKPILFDLGTVLCAVLTAFLLPPVAPLWLPVLACFLSAALKNAFSVLKKTIVSPVALSLVICHLLLPDLMTATAQIRQNFSAFALSLKEYSPSGVSALEKVLNGILPDDSLLEMFFGFRAGTIGETSALLLVLGFIFLVIRKKAKLCATITYVIALGAIIFVFPTITGVSEDIAFKGILYNLFGTSTVFCAVYLFSEPSSSPKTFKSGVVSGVIAACATVAVRYYISIELSALIGAAVMSLTAFAVDTFFPPMPFGGRTSVKKQDGQK